MQTCKVTSQEEEIPGAASPEDRWAAWEPREAYPWSRILSSWASGKHNIIRKLATQDLPDGCSGN